tara:strand:+ start:16 stop:348 length:333 start_codon:yes stop_codon:yes gene_type:complete
MSSHVWCHGTKCHIPHTLDRVRGSKGSKVIRTRKVKQTEWNKNSFYKYFCSQGCYNDFANANIERMRLLAPRNEALETPIEDPVKTKHETGYGRTYYDTVIKERVDNTAE